MIERKQIKHLVLLVPPNSSLLDVSGSLEVFVKSIDYFDQVRERVNFEYKVHIVSTLRHKQIKTSSGLPIVCEGDYKSIDYPIDTLIITGLPHVPGSMLKPEALKWIKAQSDMVRRICSICSGAFVLAEAGVLNNKKATTHWKLCERLSQKYPQIEVLLNPIFVKDGNIYTSAGGTAGMDLALALVEEDLGRSFALEMARILVLFLKRPGNQSQYSTTLEYQNSDYEPINKIREWIFEHLKEELTVETLAEQSLMSPRNFARVFLREMNITPAKYIEKIRLETACRYLVEKQSTQNEIAIQCGFKTSENMRRLFMKTYETTPAEYKRKFRSSLI